MSHKATRTLLVVAGLLALYAVGLQEARSLPLGSSGYATIAMSSAIYALGGLVAILALRAIERVGDEKRQFFLVLGAAGALAYVLSCVRAGLSENPLLAVLLDDLPKMALLIPISWIARKEKLTRNESKP